VPARRDGIDEEPRRPDADPIAPYRAEDDRDAEPSLGITHETRRCAISHRLSKKPGYQKSPVILALGLISRKRSLY
jgi:hypothetical protein